MVPDRAPPGWAVAPRGLAVFTQTRVYDPERERRALRQNIPTPDDQMPVPCLRVSAPARSPRLPRLAPALALLLLLAALAAPQAQAQTRQQLYSRALESFQWVMAEESRANRRDLWAKVIERFEAVLRAGTDTEYAPKALYYIGRSNEELALRSGLRSDAVRATDAFQRAANRFPPGHSWVDDCLYRKAEVTWLRLGDGRTAAADLRELLAAYPGGDQARAANTLLARISGTAQAPKTTAAPKAAAPKAAAPTLPPPSTAPATITPKIRAAYDRATADFQTLKKATGTPPAKLRDNAARLGEIYRTIPRTTLGARAAYFAGFASEEAGDRSGDRNDYALAAEYYARAADAFDRKDSWRDDAIFRKAQTAYRHLGDEDKAYADLLLLTAEYPDGDQAEQARALLREMDQARAQALPQPEGPMTPPPAATQSPAPEAVASGSFGEAPGPGVLTGVRYSSGDDFTRIVLDLTGPVAFKHARLPADPAQGKTHRMYVDLDKTTLGTELKRKVEIPGGFLQSIRAGQNTPSTARVVLDFKDDQEYHVLALSDPSRIVIDVFASQSVAQDKKDQQRTAARPTSPPAAPAPADDDRTPGKKEATTAHDVLAQLGMTVRTVMIDAGHGGRDPGALQYVTTKDNKGRAKKTIRTKEKDIALRAARILGKTLQERGYNVLYTRTDDTKIQLEDRVLAANIKKADLFISLHCNANNSSSVRGFETYYLGKARNDIVLRLAAKENNVDPVKISDTQKIVMDLVHSFKIEESKVLAQHVQKNCVRQLSAKYKGIVDHGARSAPFFVLIGAKMPAVLVEIGYITNPAEADLLRSDAYLQRVSDGIAAGIDSYRQELQSVRL
jgi:N-acetylmuramoyl-L-alanine amidase